MVYRNKDSLVHEIESMSNISGNN